MSCGVVVHPRRTERAVGASCGALVLPCRAEYAVGYFLALGTLPRHTVRAGFKNGCVGDFGFFELLSVALLLHRYQGVVAGDAGVVA